MNKYKWWTKEEDEELFQFMEEGIKQGYQIKYLAEKFAQKYPHLTPEQVRTHYYNLLNNKNRKNYQVRRGWTLEEEEFLLQYIKENEHKKGKIELFQEIAEKLGKNPQAVATRYYYLINKQQKKENALDTLLTKIPEISPQKLQQLAEILNKISQMTDAQKEVLSLTERVQQLEEEKAELKRRLLEAEKLIQEYEKRLKRNNSHLALI